MDKNFINELADILKARDLQEIEIENSNGRIKLTAKTNISSASKNIIVENTETIISPEISGTQIIAPLVGTFYAAASQHSEAFVKIGDTVKKGDTLFIIEAMKNMNEVCAEQNGIIKEIFVTNGEMVDFGKIIMTME